jgi:predicted ribosomally synthesized peptide with SipW-like signal peptide
LSLALILALGVGVAGTLAYSADTQTSSGNVLAAGTLNLTTNDADGVNQTLYALSMSPGETVGSVVISLQNTGTTAGATLDVAVSYAESDGDPNTVPETALAVAALLEVVTLDYSGDSGLGLGSISDTNGNTYKDVHDLAGSNLTGRTGIAASADETFTISVRLRGETPNSFQSDGIIVTMTFTLRQ